MARAADIDLTIDDFQKVADKTPYLADLKCVVRRSRQPPTIIIIYSRTPPHAGRPAST